MLGSVGSSKRMRKKIQTLCLFQGPTGVSGPKGARGAQGPPVSDIYHVKVLHNYSFLFGLTIFYFFFPSFRVQQVSLVPLAELDLQVPT